MLFDATSQHFLGVWPDEESDGVQVLDETVPELVDLFDCIYDLPVDVPGAPFACQREPPLLPHLWVEYGYAEEDYASVLQTLEEGFAKGQ